MRQGVSLSEASLSFVCQRSNLVSFIEANPCRLETERQIWQFHGALPCPATPPSTLTQQGGQDILATLLLYTRQFWPYFCQILGNSGYIAARYQAILATLLLETGQFWLHCNYGYTVVMYQVIMATLLLDTRKLWLHYCSILAELQKTIFCQL